MGLFSKEEVASVLEAFQRTEERFANGLHEEFDSALAVLNRARSKAAERSNLLGVLAAKAKEQAAYLKDHFSE